MQQLMPVNMQVTEGVYLKDPSATELGRRIIETSVRLIDELGLEAFTFGKLAQALGTAESSVYRYFDNKHKLLVYLVSWYWSWREYKLAFDTANIPDGSVRLEKGIRSILEPITEKGSFEHVDLRALYRIAVCESSKAFMTKEVDGEHKEGSFGSYKRLCDRLRQLIIDVRHDHPYPGLLSSLVMDGSTTQRFFAEHIPSILDKNTRSRLSDHFVSIIFATLNTASR
jgi:AcrR family transcriptional regulator